MRQNVVDNQSLLHWIWNSMFSADPGVFLYRTQRQSQDYLFDQDHSVLHVLCFFMFQLFDVPRFKTVGQIIFVVR